MLQGAAGRIQRMRPLNATSITSAPEQSFTVYLQGFPGGKRNNRSFTNLVRA